MKKCYAVRKGFMRGIFTKWEKCKSSVDGYSGAVYLKFDSIAYALEYLIGDGSVPCLIPYYAYNNDQCNYEYTAAICSQGKCELLSKEMYFINVKTEHALQTPAWEELDAITEAVTHAIGKGYSELVIFYNHPAVGGWGTDKIISNSNRAKEFVSFCKEKSAIINLKFMVLPTLSRYTFNEIVDILQR